MLHLHAGNSNQHPGKKKRAHHSRPDKSESHLDDDQNKLAMVQQQQQEKERLLEIKKKAEKEQALIKAHTHLYIQYKKKTRMQSLLLRLNRKSNLTNGDQDVVDDEEDEEPFCYVCRENVHKFWIRQNESDEFKWKKGIEERVSSHIEDLADNIRDSTQLQMKAKFMVDAAELLRQEDFANRALTASSSVESRDSNSKAEKKVRETAHDKAWKKELAVAKELLARAGLPAFDPLGISTLPREPPRKDEVLVNKPVLLLDESAPTETCGLKIRLWHRDAAGLRSNFLGVLQLAENVSACIFLLGVCRTCIYGTSFTRRY